MMVKKNGELKNLTFKRQKRIGWNPCGEISFDRSRKILVMESWVPLCEDRLGNQ